MKPTIANWGAAKLSGLCRRLHRQDECTGSASAEPGLPGRRGARGDPLANRFDELDTLMVLDNAAIRCSKTCAVRAASTANG